MAIHVVGLPDATGFVREQLTCDGPSQTTTAVILLELGVLRSRVMGPDQRVFVYTATNEY